MNVSHTRTPDGQIKTFVEVEYYEKKIKQYKMKRTLGTGDTIKIACILWALMALIGVILWKTLS